MRRRLGALVDLGHADPLRNHCPDARRQVVQRVERDHVPKAEARGAHELLVHTDDEDGTHDVQQEGARVADRHVAERGRLPGLLLYGCLGSRGGQRAVAPGTQLRRRVCVGVGGCLREGLRLDYYFLAAGARAVLLALQRRGLNELAPVSRLICSVAL